MRHPLRSSSENSPLYTMDRSLSESSSPEQCKRSMPNCLSLLKRECYSIITFVGLLFLRSLPNMSDAARKRTLADWVVKTKKQVVKLYAIVKWSRDAGVVQKAMVLTLAWGKDSLRCRGSNLMNLAEYNRVPDGPEPPVRGGHPWT